MKQNFLHGSVANWLLLTIVACLGLASCKPTYDPMTSIGKMADKNIPGRTYSGVSVDTSVLVTTLLEYELVNGGTGTFLTSVSGNCKAVVVSTPMDITWSREEYVDKNSYINILINMASGDSKKIRWSSNTLFESNMILSAGKKSSAMSSVYNQFSNTSWKTKGDTARYVYPFKYLGWDQAKGSAAKLTQAQIDEKRAYFAQQWVKDTIAWYNKTFDAKVPDSIRVVGKYGTDKFSCVFWVGSEKTMYVPDTRPMYEKQYATSTFTVSREAGTFLNSGQYCYHCFEQDSAHYLNPKAADANAIDSLYQFDIKGWCIGSVSGVSAFNLVARGDLKQVSWKTVNGHRDTLVNVEKKDMVKTFVITEHDPGDMATIDGVWHKYVVK